MANTCPECGNALELHREPVTLLTGTCGGCGHHWTAFRRETSAGSSETTPTVVVSAEGDGEDEGDDVEVVEEVTVEGPPCPSCGGILTFRPGAGSQVEAVCSGCAQVTAYAPAGGGERERPSRDRRSGDRPVGQAPRASNARPCRECGGPLQFTTGPDGTITGECASCGNRFTLPPRRSSPGGWAGGPSRRFDRGPPRGRFPPRGPPRGRSYDKRPGGRYGSRYSREDRDDDDEERPRRRPRRE